MKVKKELVGIKRVTLVCFLFIICCNALSSSSSESTLISKGGDYRPLANDKQLIKIGYGDKILKSYEVVKKSRAIKGLSEVLNLETKVSKGKEGIVINNRSKKANKGGVYGGGDLLRPRSKKGGCSSLRLNSSSSLASKTLALGLLFFVFF
ncbi:hypothetical protein WN943_002948 [Citrus x changshan-huyou]